MSSVQAAYENKSTVSEKDRHRALCKNLKRGLERYRFMRAFSERAIADENELNAAENMDYCRWRGDMVDSGVPVRLDGVRRNKSKTRLMLANIETMAKVMREEALKTPEGSVERRRYNVFYYLYISDERMTIGELAKGENVAPRQIYRDIDETVKAFAVLVQGYDGF